MLELHEKRESENLFPTFKSKSWKVFKKCNPRTKNRKRLIIHHSIRKMRENELLKTYKKDIIFIAGFLGHTVAIQQKHYFEVLNQMKFESL